MKSVKLIECPRDAMQGIKTFIPTSSKVQYLNSLLQVGFDTLDFGSFVSPKAIPQMRDTAEVLKGLDLANTQTKLLAIIANLRGAEDALEFEEIDYLGFPFSISEIFQMRNTHKTIEESIEVLEKILNLSARKNKQVVTYLSMGFGNPYGDPWNEDIVANWTERLAQMGVSIISLSDTVGSSDGETISRIFKHLIPLYRDIEFGAHLHTTSDSWYEKASAAYFAGCMRFDGAIKGFGGCPMAKDDLTGNMPTEKLITFFNEQKADTGLRAMAFESAYNEALKVFR